MSAASLSAESTSTVTRSLTETRAPARRLLRDERGAVTAEFVVVLPVVLVVLGLVLGGVALAAHRITLVSAASDAARLQARGDSAEERLAVLGPGVEAEWREEGSLLCVDLNATPGGGLLAALSVRGTGCAARNDLGGVP